MVQGRLDLVEAAWEQFHLSSPAVLLAYIFLLTLHQQSFPRQGKFPVSVRYCSLYLLWSLLIGSGHQLRIFQPCSCKVLFYWMAEGPAEPACACAVIMTQ